MQIFTNQSATDPSATKLITNLQPHPMSKYLLYRCRCHPPPHHHSEQSDATEWKIAETNTDEESSETLDNLRAWGKLLGDRKVSPAELQAQLANDSSKYSLHGDDDDANEVMALAEQEWETAKIDEDEDCGIQTLLMKVFELSEQVVSDLTRQQLEDAWRVTGGDNKGATLL